MCHRHLCENRLSFLNDFSILFVRQSDSGKGLEQVVEEFRHIFKARSNFSNLMLLDIAIDVGCKLNLGAIADHYRCVWGVMILVDGETHRSGRIKSCHPSAQQVIEIYVLTLYVHNILRRYGNYHLTLGKLLS
ncbi:hypothetical protein AK829_00915 [Corynebacterium riegelii]|uniref:Uncharacterized protein n=1 Tax=Corynebacterium riegelii TaxID=156976 RepID=A0A0K1R9T5_9CORY|nr:hypothetical protein AK829_00915 [Corynebacterium riegelii]